ncbi:hypothetical protein GQ457_17G010000 [Hibiscus cannabinus]
MGDAENALPHSKKRAAGREISRDNPGLDEEEGSSEQENGTFKRASDEVLANRRIVKVGRNQTTSTGIRLVPPTEPTFAPAASSGAPGSRATTTEVITEAPVVDETEVPEDGENDVNKNEVGNNQQSEKTDEKDPGSVKRVKLRILNNTQEEANDGKRAGDVSTKDKDKKDDETANADNRDRSSQNADSSAEGASLSSFQQLSSTGLAGTGFSTSAFSFGSTSKDGSTSSVPLFGLKSDRPFGFGPSSTHLGLQLFLRKRRVVFKPCQRFQSRQEKRTRKCGDGRSQGVLMRARGNYRLILNARLYPDMKLTNMDKRGITFACMNSTSEEKEGLSTFALKFKDASIVEEFRAAVTAHQSNTTDVLKAPENSPKASED